MKLEGIVIVLLALTTIAIIPAFAESQYKQSWTAHAPDIVRTSIVQNGNGTISVAATLATKNSSHVEVAYTTIDETGKTIDLQDKKLSLAAATSTNDSANLNEEVLYGFRTVQILLVDNSTQEALGSQVTLYQMAPTPDGGQHILNCYGIEQECLAGVLSGGINQPEYSPIWGWLVTQDRQLKYVGGSEYVPLCYVSGRIICSEADTAIVDARFGYDHNLTLALLRNQTAQYQQAFDVSGIPDKVSPGDAINISVQGRYAAATAQLYQGDRLVAADQADPAQPHLTFRIPANASGEYRIAVSVLDFGGKVTPYSHNYDL